MKGMYKYLQLNLETFMYTNIYGLSDPRDPELIMYVGKSDDPPARLGVHLTTARRYLNNVQPKYLWMRSILSQVKPIITVLEVCLAAEWKARERHHVSLWRAKNPLLTNVARGGDDFVTYGSHEERSERCKKAQATLTFDEKSERSKRGAEGRRAKGLPVGWAAMPDEARVLSNEKAQATMRERGIKSSFPEMSFEVRSDAAKKAAVTRKERGTGNKGGYKLKMTAEELSARAKKIAENRKRNKEARDAASI
jgi:hypothetical protein